MAGQVIHRGKETWLVRVYAGKDALGRRRWVNRTVHGPRRDAEKVLRALLSAKDDHRLTMPENVTVGKYLERWLRDYGTAVRPTTLAGYRMIVQKHLAPTLGHIRLDRLTPLTIQRYLTDKQGMAAAEVDVHPSQEAGATLVDPPRREREALSPSTVRKHAAVLHKALRQAVKWGVLAANPCDRVDAPRRRRFEPRVWDAEQVRVFLGESRRRSRHYPLYLAALLTGARAGELAGLRWRDLNLTMGTASVQQTLYRLSGDKHEGRKAQTLFNEPKTANARRTIALPSVLVEAVRALRTEQDVRCRQTGECAKGCDCRVRDCVYWHDFGLVFCQDNGRPLHMHNVTQRDFRRVVGLEGLRADLRKQGVAEDALPKGLPRIRFHDLRHTSATLLLQQNVHPKVVSERLGHSGIGITLDIYSHVLPGMQEQAAARLEERLFGRAQA